MPQTKFNDDRRKAVVCGSSCAALAAIPALTFSHGHPAVGFVSLGVQAVLLVLAIRFIARAKSASNG
jgi:hypothetical protein